MRSVVAYACAIAIAISIFSIPASGHAAPQCPPGQRPATAADSFIQNNKNIPVGTCYDPNDVTVGTQASDAKDWLAKHSSGVDKSRINCLDSDFAQKLKALMEKVPGGPPTITGAYRSTAEQQNIINSGSGATRVTTSCGSFHPWGLAVDFNNAADKQKITWMRANVRSSGLATIGEWDYGHFQSGSGRTGQCGVCAVSGTVAGGSGQGFGQQPPPGNPFQQAMQGLFAPPQPMSCQQGSMMMNGSCVPQQNTQQQAYPNPYAPSTPPPSSPTTSGQPTQPVDATNPNTNTNTNTNNPSTVLDLLNDIANPTSTPDTTPVSATPTALKLITDIAFGTQLAGIRSTSTEGSTSTSFIPAVSQTFTSQDLNQSPAEPPTNQSSTFAILENLKQTLLRILAFLQPFGGGIKQQTVPMYGGME